jgi:hypothetical protein
MKEWKNFSWDVHEVSLILLYYFDRSVALDVPIILADAQTILAGLALATSVMVMRHDKLLDIDGV